MDHKDRCDLSKDRRRFELTLAWLEAMARDEVILDRQSRRVYDDLMDRIMKQI